MMLDMVLLTCWRPVQRLCNINHVDNDRLDSIPFAFNLDEIKTNTDRIQTVKTQIKPVREDGVLTTEGKSQNKTLYQKLCLVSMMSLVFTPLLQKLFKYLQQRVVQT